MTAAVAVQAEGWQISLRTAMHRSGGASTLANDELSGWRGWTGQVQDTHHPDANYVGAE